MHPTVHHPLVVESTTLIGDPQDSLWPLQAHWAFEFATWNASPTFPQKFLTPSDTPYCPETETEAKKKRQGLTLLNSIPPNPNSNQFFDWTCCVVATERQLLYGRQFTSRYRLKHTASLHDRFKRRCVMCHWLLSWVFRLSTGLWRMHAALESTYDALLAINWSTFPPPPRKHQRVELSFQRSIP